MLRKLLIPCLFFLTAPAWASFSGYTYQRTLTVNHGQVSNGTLNYPNFPVLISTTDVTLSTGVGGHLANPNGFDLVFSTMSDCSFLLHWDTETVNNTGALPLNAWVNVPSISSSTDTTLYMCYGNSSITSYQGYSTSTWDSNYQLVMHMNTEADLSTFGDSTANGRNGTGGIGANVGMTTGQVDGASNWDGTTGAYMFAPTIPITTDVTMEAWVFSSAFDSQNGMVVNKAPINQEWFIGNFSNAITLRGGAVVDVSCPAPSNSNWHYVVATISGSTTGTVFIDGTQCNTGAVTAPLASTGVIEIGQFSQTAFNFNGKIDELRISDVARSPDVIKTEYNNQNAPNSFISIGSESSGSTASTKSLFSIQGGRTAISGAQVTIK